MTFLERREALRNLAEQNYRIIEWRNPLSLDEMPIIPDWMIPYVVKNVFGTLGVEEDGRLVPNKKVLAIITSTASQITELLQIGVSRQQSGQATLPPVEYEACGAVAMLHEETSPPDFSGLTPDEVLDAELAIALQLLSFWVAQVIIVRVRELRLEERTRG
jgi:hypothetical protein